MKRLFLLILGIASMSFANPPYKLGDTVRDFSLKNTDGTMVSLSSLGKAKGVILIFDCNTCPFSKLYNERIIGLNAKYESAGYPVVAVNSNDPAMSPGDSFEKMVAQAKKKNYDFPYLFDESQEVGKAFGATNTPQVFVLKKESSGFVVNYIGAIDNNPRDARQASKKYVEEAVDALLAGKKPATPTTTAIGCGIKYRNI